MIVFSPLSLYTTYLGWQTYDLIFDAFFQSGLWFIGFVFVGWRFFKNIVAPSGATHHASTHALNHFLFELCVLVFICALFVYPSVPLTAESIKFKPACATKAQESKLGETGTSYDNNLGDLISDNVKVPFGFSFIQNFFSGITYGLMNSSMCVDGLKSIKSDMVSMHLPSELRQEITSFKQQCFMEARLQFTSNPPPKTKYEQTLKKYGGERDLTWVGSHVFNMIYYPTTKTKSPVARYSYGEYPADNFKAAEIKDDMLPKHGFPDCHSWWKDIRQSLVDLTDDQGFINENVENRAIYFRILRLLEKHKLAGYQYDSKEDFAHDLIARTLIENNEDFLDKKGAFDVDNNAVQSFFANKLNRAGQTFKSWTFTPLKREGIRQTVPVMQALVMFFLIIIMPLIVALSGCSPKSVGAFCGLMIVLIFFNFIWFMVGMLEKRLLESASGELASVIQNTAVMFYFVAPILLLKLSAHWGAGSASALVDFIAGNEKVADQNAESGKQVVKEVTSRATAAVGKL